MRKSPGQLLSFLAILSFAAWMGGASATVYDLNRTVGSGAVTGFIETDGTLGALSYANIVNYSLTLTSANLLGGSPTTIVFANPHGIGVGGSGLSASLTALSFDFSIPDSYFFIQDYGLNASVYGLSATPLCSSECTGEFILWHYDLSIPHPAEQNEWSSMVTFATATAVPEPATLLLIGAGLFGLWQLRRWQRR